MNEYDQTRGEDRESDRIKQDIDRTLCEMDDTVTQLQEQMRPKVLLKRAGSAMLSPGGIIGIGVAWLVIDRLTGRGRHERYEVGRRYRSEGDWAPSRAAGRASGTVSRGTAYARDKISSVAGQAREKASDLSHRAQDALHTAKDTISDMGEKVGDRVGRAARYAKDQAVHATEVVQRSAVRAGEQVSDLYEENPLALGAVALAAGLVGGLVLPSTRKEDELLGPARDQLVEKAKGIGREVAQAGKDAVQTVTQTAKEEAQRSQGQPMALRAANVIGRSAEAAAQQVQGRIDQASNQGINPD
jgi:hypothetical protein